MTSGQMSHGLIYRAGVGVRRERMYPPLPELPFQIGDTGRQDTVRTEQIFSPAVSR